MSSHNRSAANEPRVGPMPAHKYRAFPTVDLPDRQWPSRVISAPPRWCSVDLRDGNQALVEPMGPDRKRVLFDALVAMGFREIEVGFPSASETERAFVRELIESRRIPDDVTIQVLTQAREDLIRGTFEAIRGARRVIVHLYNSTSPIQRRVVFGEDRAGIREIAVRGAELVKALAVELPDTEVQLEYSPESFSGTELDFAVEICERVMEVWEPTPESPVILNLPATVEMASPNVYADQIEWFARHLDGRDRVVLSVHPHNDRGCAVAAAELAIMAGAQRVEGTLFGNGERTGNVDVVTLALNLFTQGVDPGLDVSDVAELVRVAEYCTRLPVHARHPYAGELVYTAFSGSHQDAIRKGLAARRAEGVERWEVPYLPIEPGDVGRSYEEVIRVNSQSGKGGVAYLLERDHGLELPRWLQVEFAGCVQRATDASGEEMRSDALAALFEAEYLRERSFEVVEYRSAPAPTGPAGAIELEAVVREGLRERVIRGEGSGPIDAFLDGLRRADIAEVRVRDYVEHAVGAGNDAVAVAYVRVESPDGSVSCGVGRHESIVVASFEAVLGAEQRRRSRVSGDDSAQPEAGEDLRVDERAAGRARVEPVSQPG